jgi:hypothetical protein
VARAIPYRDLRRGNKLGVHFGRQQIIAGFIVDFYCHKAALVIEVDGDIHDLQKEAPLSFGHPPYFRNIKFIIKTKLPCENGGNERG